MRAVTRRLRVAIHIACAAAVGPASAARPLVTDDARIVDPKACQLETWVRRNTDSTEFWALPACNPTGNVELTFGGAMTRELGATHTSDVQIQAKTIFRPLEPNGWGVGAVLGNLRRPAEQGRDFTSNLYGYIPVSVSFAEDRVVMHVNAGMLRPESRSAHRATWGVGSEIRFGERFYFIPEVFNQTGGRPFFQTGLRYWIVPGRMQIDTTYGDRLGHSRGDRSFSVGFRLLTPAFLP